MTVATNKDYVADKDGEFKYPALGDPLPPGGADVHLLTKGGICVRGKWPSNNEDDFYVGWAPLPKRNHEREALIKRKGQR